MHNIVKALITSRYLYPLWRIGWLERLFFLACRLITIRRPSAFLDILFGFDISKYQGAVDFLKMLAYGAKFLILRCGYAVFKDERFEEYIKAAYGVLPLAAYHFYDPVYDPLAQANKLIAILEPHRHKIRRVWLDFEFWWSGAFTHPKYWKIYRDRIKAAGYKIGIYTRSTWWDSRVGEYAAEFAGDPLWAAQYNNVLNLIPRGWIKAKVWQRGTPAIGLLAGVSSREIDESLWNDEFHFAEEWGEAPSPPPTAETPDAATQLFPGVLYHRLRRFESDCYLTVIDLTGKRVHVTDTKGVLRTVSQIAREHAAQVAINGDGWWRTEPPSPLSIAASDGRLYQPAQYDDRYWMHISKDNQITFAWRDASGLYNAVSGTRLIVRTGSWTGATDGQLHPRTAAGVTLDGKLLLAVVDGRSTQSRGATLPELASLLIEFGAVTGLELDGGGSSAMWAKDQIVNHPSDGQERAVINHLVITGDWTMSDYFEIKSNSTSSRSIRTGSAVTFSKLGTNGDLFTGKIAKAGAGPDDVYVYAADVPNVSFPGGFAARKGDTWRKVFENDGKPVTGWIAEIHLGQTMITKTLISSPTPPPPAGTLPTLTVTVGGEGYETVIVELKPKA